MQLAVAHDQRRKVANFYDKKSSIDSVSSVHDIKARATQWHWKQATHEISELPGLLLGL